LENSLFQAPSSSLQKKREDGSTNQQGNKATMQQSSEAWGSETTNGGFRGNEAMRQRAMATHDGNKTRQ